MICKDKGAGEGKTEPGDRVTKALESFLAERKGGVQSMNPAGLGEVVSSAELVRQARAYNASTLVLARAQASFRTWNPAQPHGKGGLPTVKAQGTVEIIDLRKGEVIWKQELEANGFGQAMERAACEDALANMAKRAIFLLQRDPGKLGL